ncbi:MAG: VOC family protein [Planctomycetota bacterium]
MAELLGGLHHVTSFAGAPGKNVAFHRDVLGLRLVKTTVNFDDPGTLHLYFGDEVGSPGTIFTSFPSPRHAPGRSGTPEIASILVEGDGASMDSWRASGGAEVTQTGVVLRDPDGITYRCREGKGVRLAGVSVRVPQPEDTASFLVSVLGFERSADGACQVVSPSGVVRVEFEASNRDRPRLGAGSIHHVAWRVPDEDAQARVAAALRQAGVAATPVQDRNYFRSIYFRIPGGVLFEVATDGPGFAVDEPVESLGEALCLPAQFESRRAELEANLPSLDA